MMAAILLESEFQKAGVMWAMMAAILLSSELTGVGWAMMADIMLFGLY